MRFDKFKDIISKRAELYDEDYIGIEECWKEMTDIFSANISETISFLNECTAEEFSWLSEVFDEIAIRTKSREFVSELRKLLIKYPEESEKYNILYFVESAEDMIDNNGVIYVE